VFQDFRLLDHLSTFDNVALPLRIQGQRPEAYAPDVESLLRWVGLGDKLQAMPSVLSGGEKQRAAIARAVISKPDILLADEPTGNVDKALAQRLLHLFAQLNKQGTTVLFATHDESLLRQVKAPVFHLEVGRLLTP
jgi:cell division transport system ATP-binding protein